VIPPIFTPGVMPTWEEQNDVKSIPVAMTKAALNDDMDTVTELMPEGWLDAVNALGTAVLMLRAVLRSHVGWDPEEGEKVLDLCLDVIKRGQGL
jgi:hypothetical protein